MPLPYSPALLMMTTSSMTSDQLATESYRISFRQTVHRRGIISPRCFSTQDRLYKKRTGHPMTSPGEWTAE